MSENLSSAPADLRCLHAIVHGHVQGVGFRFFVLRAVEDLPVTGWVRNRRDGTVEVEAEGAAAALQALLAHLQQGPHGAYVTRVEATWSPAGGKYSSFGIRYF
ncbi:MAG: acylphosphatase [Chloroflexi bacterium]|nr:acylphosphatase [Chloroflexota bacterium]